MSNKEEKNDLPYIKSITDTKEKKNQFPELCARLNFDRVKFDSDSEDELAPLNFESEEEADLCAPLNFDRVKFDSNSEDELAPLNFEPEVEAGVAPLNLKPVALDIVEEAPSFAAVANITYAAVKFNRVCFRQNIVEVPITHDKIDDYFTPLPSTQSVTNTDNLNVVGHLNLFGAPLNFDRVKFDSNSEDELVPLNFEPEVEARVARVRQNIVEEPITQIKIDDYFTPLPTNTNNLNVVDHLKLAGEQILPEVNHAEVDSNPVSYDNINSSGIEVNIDAAEIKLEPVNYEKAKEIASKRSLASIPEEAHPPAYYKLILLITSIFLYIIGYILDISLLYQYAVRKEWNTFVFTLLCIAIPTIIVQLYSCKLHDDNDELKPLVKLIHVFIMGPAHRFWICFKYGSTARKQWQALVKSYSKANNDLHENLYDTYISTIEKYVENIRNVSFLGCIYAFLETGPQVTLQLYVLLTYQLSQHKGNISKTHAITITKIAFSIVMIAKSLACFKGDVRTALGRKLSIVGLLLQFLYRLMLISSRALAIVLFATVFNHMVFGLLAFHVLIMYFWLKGDKKGDEKGVFFTRAEGRLNGVFEILTKIVMAVIYTFCFFNVFEGNTLLVQSTYYLLFFAENISMMGAWLLMNGRHFDTYEIVATSLVFLTMFCGIILLVVFYEFFHPSILREEKRMDKIINSIRGNRRRNVLSIS